MEWSLVTHNFCLLLFQSLLYHCHLIQIAMNDHDHNGEEGENEPAGAIAAIESLDDYVRRFGLPHADDAGDHSGGEFNGLNRNEAMERVRAEEDYARAVIEKHQLQKASRADETNNDAIDAESENAVISLLLGGKNSLLLDDDESTIQMPVRPLIAFCDTAKRMVTSRSRYGVKQCGPAEDELSTGGDNTQSQSDTAKKSGIPIMELSLVEFDANAVVQFTGVLLSLHKHQQKREEEVSSSEPSRKRRINDGKDEATNKYALDLINEGKISEKYIVECLKLAHYLQCRVILEALTSVLDTSIDCHNCMAICSLADALDLTSLFESSVNFVIDRLDVLDPTTPLDENSEGKAKAKSGDDDSNQETIEEIWSSLPHELRSRILTMRNVMRSSVIGRGSKVSGIFFSSGNEFLAIFVKQFEIRKNGLQRQENEGGESFLNERKSGLFDVSDKGGWLIRVWKRRMTLF